MNEGSKKNMQPSLGVGVAFRVIGVHHFLAACELT